MKVSYINRIQFSLFQVILSQARIIAQQSKWTELLTARHTSTVSAGKDKETSQEQASVKTQVAVVPDEEDGYR